MKIQFFKFLTVFDQIITINTKMAATFLGIGVLTLLNCSVDHNGKDKVEMVSIPVETITDKIRGGMLGQILGNLNGIEHENKYIDEPGKMEKYVPSLPDGARTDDDTDFEWIYIYEMQKEREPFLSNETICQLWTERINKGIWCSNRYARYLMDIGVKPPITGYSAVNPWAEFNISGQFLCETFSLIAPSMPQTASRIALNYTTVAINDEPAQTTQLFATMISTAFIEDDINKILEAGVAALDRNSMILKITDQVKQWHKQYPDNWKTTRRLLKEKYTQENGGMRDRNGYELNTGSIIAALLYGNGDFAESLRLVFNFGWDADCNAATLGTILGVRDGYRKMLNHNNPENPDWQVVDRYKNTTRDNMPMDETITSYADRIIELFEMVNQNNGGTKMWMGKKMVYQIPVEQPENVLKLKSLEEQKQKLRNQFQKQIKDDLVRGNRKDRARAVYFAICLDMNKDLSREYPEKWKAACYDLSGYWKVIDVIFQNDFQKISEFQEKFLIEGFKYPEKSSYTEKDLYNDTILWKDPLVLH